MKFFFPSSEVASQIDTTHPASAFGSVTSSPKVMALAGVTYEAENRVEIRTNRRVAKKLFLVVLVMVAAFSMIYLSPGMTEQLLNKFHGILPNCGTYLPD
jgi:hypothetical protein